MEGGGCTDWMQISQLLLFCRRRHIGKVIQGNPIGSVSDTIDYKPYNLEAMFTSIIVLYVYYQPVSHRVSLARHFSIKGTSFANKPFLQGRLRLFLPFLMLVTHNECLWEVFFHTSSSAILLTNWLCSMNTFLSLYNLLCSISLIPMAVEEIVFFILIYIIVVFCCDQCHLVLSYSFLVVPNKLDSW